MTWVLIGIAVIAFAFGVWHALRRPKVAPPYYPDSNGEYQADDFIKSTDYSNRRNDDG